MIKMAIDKFGNKEWRNEYSKLHRLDGPAIEWAIEWEDGNYWWHINGIMYRDFKEFQVAGGLSDSDMMLLRLKYGEIGS